MTDGYKELKPAIEEAGKAAEVTAETGISSWEGFTTIIHKATTELSNFTKEGLAAAIAQIKMTTFATIQSINDMTNQTMGIFRDIADAQIARAKESMNKQIEILMYGFDTYNNELAKLDSATATHSSSMSNSWGQVADEIEEVAEAAEEAAGKISAPGWGGVSGGSATPSYAVGTPYVPETSLAMVHKGEAIIPANQNTNNSFTPTININNPVVRNDSDLSAIQRMVEQALNDSKRQFSRSGFELAPGM